MTGKVVNLSKARKARAKGQDKARADANAVKFGRTKGEKAKERAEADKATRDLDGHERE
ncbi:DUF4169 family protein [Silicimonas algicola]|uniref:Uncharacterized protein DUF4169 n=1 Tax=Silicimonas algicola TaxID=1826607 RepID=A0A316GCG6_9RHOB|nr:DUF4169 family protein [Silicimonas algicola]AZQ66296.1 DUF4169 family protein [Silicimonas algicola]PWK58618.1 uncharacterized protein DUF4169 [Silicimonas algicola]